MKISKVTVNKLYIPLITTMMCLVLGFSAEAQLKTPPKNFDSLSVLKAKELDLIAQLKKAVKNSQKSSVQKTKILDLILNGDNLPVKPNQDKKQEVEGPRTGGGNGCALSITQNKTKLLGILAEEKILQKEELTLMRKKLETTKYYVVTDSSKMVLDGEKKDAINSPDENTIYFSEHFCRAEMSDVSARSMSLLFHEYLGLIGLDDRMYQKSGQFLQIMSERNQANNELIEFLKSQIANDLEQQESLFKGQMALFKAKMQEVYGDRLRNEETPQIEVLKIRGSVPDILNKFNTKKYDVHWNATEDAQKALYGIFDSFEQENYIITVKYKASTTRSFETISKEFLLKKEVFSQEARPLSFAVAAAVMIKVPAKISDRLVNKTTYTIRSVDTDDKD